MILSFVPCRSFSASWITSTDFKYEFRLLVGIIVDGTEATATPADSSQREPSVLVDTSYCFPI